jgi:hypothetical protein
VSQQFPQARRPGQHTEQVNFISDPIEGLTRRHGSKFVAEKPLGAMTLDPVIADTANWRHFAYNNAGKDYVVLHRTAARSPSCTLPPVMVYNRTDNVFLDYVRPVTDAVLDLLESGGVSAITAIGKYAFMAGNTVVPAAVSTDMWGNIDNQKRAVVWIRGGAYARTFKVAATKTDNTVVNFEYTTPRSSYPTLLDTSDIPAYMVDPAGGTQTNDEGAVIDGGVYTLLLGDWSPTALTAKKGTTAMTNVSPAAPTTSTQFAWAAGASTVTFHSSNEAALDVSVKYTSTKVAVNPVYASMVSDRTSDYNTAVTEWIGQAAEAVQPQNIAEKLKVAAVAAGLTTAIRVDSSVCFDNVKTLVVQDGGDGSLIRGADNEVPSITEVTSVHFVGKIVKVRPADAQDSFYLKAIPKDPAATTGFVEVSWVEGPGIEHNITSALVYGTVSGANFYVASTATLLTSILPGTHPEFNKSTVGDADSSPLPYFIGRKITYLGVFQDRIMVGSGGVIRASRVGDYLNFFRTSVLTAPADDPLEMLSQGSEDDELRHGVLYDRDLVIFGRKRQYAISGRTSLTPSAANMAVMSSHEGAGDLPPLAVGGLIFYGKQGENNCSVLEVRPGAVAESPESYPISTQVNTYFVGNAIEIATLAKPSTLFLRTKGTRNGLYVFSYLDFPDGRKMDSWSRWEFPAVCGSVVGIAPTPDGMLVFSVRSIHSQLWIVADLCPINTGLAPYPYLDSIRPWATVAANTGSVRDQDQPGWYGAFNSESIRFLIGSDLYHVNHPYEDGGDSLLEEFPTEPGLMVGAENDALFIPTNPFVKDTKGNAITTGRFTITKMLLTFTKSSGFEGESTSKQVSVVTQHDITNVVSSISETLTPTSDDSIFNGFVFGDPNAEIGRVPVTDGQQSIPIGRETREYDLVIRARTWLPLTVTALEYVGQFFNRSRRL